jgi:hypothetical protein
MRTSLKLILLFLTVSFFSCENEENVTQTGATNNTLNKQDQNDLIGIGYGITSSCAKNILVFPTWDRYYQVMEYLDTETEKYCDAFDATVPSDATDAEYDFAAANAIPPFDEDNKLATFENSFKFCSLRKKLNTLEDDWLVAQGDGAWDTNTDPDNHFIDDDTERAMLNEGVEVIVGGGRNLIIYKFTEDGGYIEIANMDLEALQQINQGTIPVGNANVVVVPPKPDDLIGCKQKIREVKYEYDPLDLSYKLKRTSKVRKQNGANFDSNDYVIKSTIIAKTKSYKKRNNGGYKLQRSWIIAGIEGETIATPGIAYDMCSAELSKLNIKIKRRKKVKVKETIEAFQASLPDVHYLSVRDNMLYSLHTKGNIIINKDFYDMSSN